jgi:alginate O-acetyltransferase complex protein AlgF
MINFLYFWNYLMLRMLGLGWLRVLIIAVAPGLLLAPSGHLFAQDAALYDDPPPDDAAYMRFFGFPADAEISAFGLAFSAERLTTGHYNILRADAIEGVTKGQIMTAVPNAQGDVIILEEPQRARRKVMLQLVNLTTQGPVSLKTSDGEVEIIAPSDVLTIGSREVNPIQVTVAVFDADGSLGEPMALTLRTNQHLTFVVSADGVVTMNEDDAISEPMK